MADFDPDKFQQKYKHYFTELQQAYRNAFERMEQSYDSEVVHTIDQQVLAESEPFYEGEGQFRVELPEDAHDRVEDPDAVAVIEAYREVLEAEIAITFGFDQDSS